MKKGDRIRTEAWLKVTDEVDCLEGEIYAINSLRCLDGSLFEKIMVRFDSGQILPCLREELELI